MDTISTGQSISGLRQAVDCLIQIDTDPVYRTALEDVTNDATISATRIGELLSRIENMKTNIFQVVGFYLVFQSVLITVVAQSSFLRKGNLWSPLALSAVAAGACIIPVWQNGMAIANMRGDLHIEENIHKVAEIARSELRRSGLRYQFTAATPPTSKTLVFTCVYFIPYALILLFLICFTLLILISQWRILSDAR